MQVAFGPEGGAAPVPAPVTEKVVTPTPVDGVTVESVNTHVPAAAPVSQALTVRSPSSLAPAGLVLGDKIPEFKDIILPRLNIAQNIGNLKDTYQPGSLVYNQTTLLFVPPVVNKDNGAVIKPGLPAVNMVILGFRPTRYVEKVEGGGRGVIVDTEDAVRTHGGTLDWNEFELKKKDGIKLFESLAEALVAIERPEHCIAQGANPSDDDPVFVYDVAGKKYAIAIWGLKGMAYTVAKTAFFTPRSVGCLRKGGYPSYVFSVTTKWKPGKKPGSGAFIPVPVPTGPTSAPLLEFVSQILNG
jgi:hypothetical protein